MINNLKKYYDTKYNTGDYRDLYGGAKQDVKGVLPPHYLLCALYIKNILLVSAENKILEVGCGVGSLLYEMNSLGYQNIMGIDISDKARELSIMPDIIFQGEAERINFEDQRFDLIISIGTYEHIIPEHLDLSLKEILRVGRKAVLWIDSNEEDVDHYFNEDEMWWANRIIEVTNAKSVYVDKKMTGGSGTHPILVNFDLSKESVNVDLDKDLLKEKLKRGGESYGR